MDGIDEKSGKQPQAQNVQGVTPDGVTTPPAYKTWTPSKFARHIKELADQNDTHFCFFLGAGCSISSGIPGASALTRRWIKKAKQIDTDSNDTVLEWAQNKFPDFNRIG